MSAQKKPKPEITDNKIIHLTPPRVLTQPDYAIAKRDSNQIKEISLNSSQENHIKACLDLTRPATFAVGPAGGGRTFISALVALYLLKQGIVDKIIASRPAVSAGEELGFLPGEIGDKVGPFAEPIYAALKMLNFEPEGNNLIEIVPFAFMRGRTWHNTAIIGDEIQNATPNQMHMLLTRIGEGSFMFLNGDFDQCDLPERRQPDGSFKQITSGLTDHLDLLEQRSKMPLTDIGLHEPTKLQNVVSYDPKHVVRSPIVQELIELKTWQREQKNKPTT